MKAEVNRGANKVAGETGEGSLKESLEGCAKVILTGLEAYWLTWVLETIAHLPEERRLEDFTEVNPALPVVTDFAVTRRFDENLEDLDAFFVMHVPLMSRYVVEFMEPALSMEGQAYRYCQRSEDQERSLIDRASILTLWKKLKKADESVVCASENEGEDPSSEVRSFKVKVPVEFYLTAVAKVTPNMLGIESWDAWNDRCPTQRIDLFARMMQREHEERREMNVPPLVDTDGRSVSLNLTGVRDVLSEGVVEPCVEPNFYNALIHRISSDGIQAGSDDPE